MDDTHAGTKEQTDRTDRAQSAILAGRFQVVQTDPLQWTVRNGDNLPYTVSLHGADWSCTCPDFQQQGPDLRCKHIEGVRILEQSNPAVSSDNDPVVTHPDEYPDGQESRSARIIGQLRQPLDMARVKHRQAPGSGSVPYLEGHTIIDRANEIFDFAWSFELVSSPQIVRWQKKVLAWNDLEKKKTPVIDLDGKVQTEEVGIVYITGKVLIDLDGATISHSDLGRCPFTGDTPEALDMALAGAVTDCLKRCFRQMGNQFGNHLYDRDISQSGQSARNGSSSTRRKDPPERKYASGQRVDGNPSEQDAFDRHLAKTGKVPASRDALRSWLAVQKQPAQPAATAA